MRPTGGGKQIKLVLEGLMTQKGTVPVPELVDRLGRLQNLIYTAGEYVLDEPFKDAGRRPVRITERCTLIFKDIVSGSTELVTEIPDCQGTLTDSGLPYGIQALNLVANLIDAVENNEDPNEEVNQLIDNLNYRNKIARQLDALIPSDEVGTKVSLELGDGRRRSLPSAYRPRVERLFLGHVKGAETCVKGAITRIRFTGERSIDLWTTSKRSFKCSFEPELIEHVAELAGRLSFVEVRGTADTKPSGEIVGIKEISSIEEARDMNLHSIIWRDSEFRLKRPLIVVVDVNLAEEMWTITNDELGISSFGRDYDSALDAFQEEFAVLVEQYVKESDENLTEDAQELKRKLMDLIGE